MALRADYALITSARFACGGHSTLRPRVEPVGLTFAIKSAGIQLEPSCW